MGAFLRSTGDGSTLTDSGYPRTVREWRRGTPLAEAPLVFEGAAADVSVGGSAYLDRGCRYEMRVRALTFCAGLGRFFAGEVRGFRSS